MTQLQPASQITLPGFKILLVGDSGNGKTHAVRTLLGTGIQPYVLATEPGMRALAPCDNPACTICTPENRKAPPIPWAYVPPTAGSIDILMDQANDVLTKNQSALATATDTKRKESYNQFVDVLKLIKNFVSFDGVSYGPVTSWNTDRCLVLDSLTGLGDMVFDLFSGRRMLYDKPDYLIAQRGIKNFLKLLVLQLRCHVTVIAHTGRGQDALEYSNKITVHTVGNKLAPELPPMFDDMPHAEREGANFTWSTATTSAVSKARNLPYKSGLKPSFAPIVTSWQKAGGIILPTTV